MVKSRKITANEAKALAEGETYSEKLSGRGAGVLLLVGRKQSVSAYYRYTDPDGKRPWIELGSLTAEFSIKDAREKCAVLNADRKLHPHLKEWLEAQHLRSRAVDIAVTAEAERAGRMATLEDLLNDYVAHLKILGRSSAVLVEKSFTQVVFKDLAHIGSMKAKDIGPEHIVEILRPVSARGAKVYRNRMRSYLHAAFQYGLKGEYDETRTSAKSFGLTHNPVAAVPALAGVEKEGTRALTDAELRQFYQHIADVKDVGPMMAVFFRFLIATAGQRPTQVLAATHDAYDDEQRTIRIIDRKGRGSQPRVHLVPLTDRARALLSEVEPLTKAYSWPFTSYGVVPISVMSLKNAIKRFLDSDYGKIDGQQMPHFTSKDIRRTCKQLMVRTGIRRDLRNLLQNHGQTGVDTKHYANDPLAHLPEKRQAMIQYEAALADVLEGKKKNKVAPIARRR
jgi:integrase